MAAAGDEPGTQKVALPWVTKRPRFFASAFFTAPPAPPQQFMVKQPHTLVQTPFAGSQQDLSALQHPAIPQQEPEAAQQLPLAQHEGSAAEEVALRATTGAVAEAMAAAAKAATKMFLTMFIDFFPDLGSCYEAARAL